MSEWLGDYNTPVKKKNLEIQHLIFCTFFIDDTRQQLEAQEKRVETRKDGKKDEQASACYFSRRTLFLQVAKGTWKACSNKTRDTETWKWEDKAAVDGKQLEIPEIIHTHQARQLSLENKNISSHRVIAMAWGNKTYGSGREKDSKIRRNLEGREHMKRRKMKPLLGDYFSFLSFIFSVFHLSILCYYTIKTGGFYLEKRTNSLLTTYHLLVKHYWRTFSCWWHHVV